MVYVGVKVRLGLSAPSHQLGARIHQRLGPPASRSGTGACDARRVAGRKEIKGLWAVAGQVHVDRQLRQREDRAQDVGCIHLWGEQKEEGQHCVLK